MLSNEMLMSPGPWSREVVEKLGGWAEGLAEELIEVVCDAACGGGEEDEEELRTAEELEEALRLWQGGSRASRGDKEGGKRPGPRPGARGHWKLVENWVPCPIGAILGEVQDLEQTLEQPQVGEA